MDLGISGRTAFVLGASTGIGYAIARQLLEAGVSVTIASRHNASLTAAAHRLSEFGDVATLVVDATDGSASATLNNHFKDDTLDMLVVAIGGSIRSTFDELDDTDWEANYTLNVLGPVRAIRTLVPNLRRSASGSILLLGAAASKMPYKNQVVSNVHKAGTLALVKTLALELADDGALRDPEVRQIVCATDAGRDGIRVNAVAPGRTKTRLWLDRAATMAADRGCTPEQILEEFSQEIPIGRFAEPEEIASVAAFVVSERASYMTGQNISVDGGIGRGLL